MNKNILSVLGALIFSTLAAPSYANAATTPDLTNLSNPALTADAAVWPDYIVLARRGRGADDPAGDDRGGRGADDPAGHQ